MSLDVRFWGVRGSIACPGAHFARYGGNTSCVEVISGDTRLILDAGTGLRELGNERMARGQLDTTLLLSHTHWDHINGFPFFSPIYQEAASVRVLAGHVKLPGGVRSVFDRQLSAPVFPVPLAQLKAKVSFEDFSAGERFTLGNLDITTAPLNHPDDATAYRIASSTASICYVTDTEHTPGKPNETILGLIQDADLVIYDSTYTDEQFSKFVGWGHSTWQEAVRLCQAANVQRLAIFHHAPEHHDNDMDAIAKAASTLWPGHATIAREGTLLSFP